MTCVTVPISTHLAEKDTIKLQELTATIAFDTETTMVLQWDFSLLWRNLQQNHFHEIVKI